MMTCEHVDSALIEQEREAWIARAIAAGMTEADARAVAAKMPGLDPVHDAKPARKRARKVAAKVGEIKADSAASPARKRSSRSPSHPSAGPGIAPAVEMSTAPATLLGYPASLAALPGFSDELRAIPNHLARSPLFAPIRPGRRTMRENELLPSPRGVTIHYSGPQLDQADCDAFMQLIWLQRSQFVGAPIKIVRQAFMHAIGRQDGGSDYAWLQSTLQRLQHAHVRIENERYVMTAQLLGRVIEDKISSEFHVVLDPCIVDMFAPSSRSLVDWEKRLRIEKRVDLAKWLHNFMASHADRQQFHALENLRQWSGYASPLRKFREAVAEALDELARLEVISEPGFYERKSPGAKKAELMVKWVRC